MSRNGQSRLSALSSRPNRRGFRLHVESLESRQLLATTAAAAAVAAAVTPDRGGGGGYGGYGGYGGGNQTQVISTPVAGALSPAQIDSTYSDTTGYTGKGEWIAIVDAYNDPNIQSDLATFDATYGLPSAKLVVMNEYGQTTNLPQTDDGWAGEISMDVEWAHAAAPGAGIVLVEANSESNSDLLQALKIGMGNANVVSMSWGIGEFPNESAYDIYFNKANVTYLAAAGDDGGAGGAEWPAVSDYVVGVGGTSLNVSTSPASETAWDASFSYAQGGYLGGGGGASAYESIPSFQAAALGDYNGTRMTPDVSADSDPNTGLSVYDSVPDDGTAGWSQVGGTSAATPVWAGIIADADQARAANGLQSLSSSQTLSLLYGGSESGGTRLSSYSSLFHDITTGATYAGSATVGYDMATGLGSPDAAGIIYAAANYRGSTLATRAAVASSTTATPKAVQARDVVFTVTVSSPTVTTPATATVTAPATSSVVATLALAPTASPSPSATTSNLVAAAASAPLAATSNLPAQALATTPPASVSFHPVQALARAEATPPYSAHESAPQAVPLPTGPGLFLEPAGQPGSDEETPLLALALASSTSWNSTIDAFLDGDSPADWAVAAPPFDPAADLEESSPALNPTFAAGVAFAIWGLSEFRLSRLNRDRRRRTLASGRATRADRHAVGSR